MSSRLFDGALAVLIGALGVAEIWVPFPSVSGEGSREASTVLVLLVSCAWFFGAVGRSGPHCSSC
jgi:hypothetical protein